MRTVNLFLDLETVPDSERFAPPMRCSFMADVKEVVQPKTMKKQDTIDAFWKDRAPVLRAQYEQEAMEKADEEYDKAMEKWHKLSLESLKNQVVCIGVGLDRQEPEIFFDKNEAKLITQWYEWYNELRKSYKTRFITFNGKNFDMPILANRLLKYVSPTAMNSVPWDTKPWDDELHFDIFHRFPTSERYPSLNSMASFLGIQGKDGVDGSNVLELYQSGAHDRLKQYQSDDIILTREVATYMGIR
jgi:DNA polymerase elongation subunit (family B)